MSQGKAVVREQIERIPGVTRTWFEFEFDDTDSETKVLVVEVNFNTDPNSTGYSQSIIDAIQGTAKSVLTDATTMIMSKLRIVPVR